jgi:hypothetical protein
MKIIEKTKWDTIDQANAYISGILCLSDMVLDYAEISIDTEVIIEEDKMIVLVFEQEDDDIIEDAEE